MTIPQEMTELPMMVIMAVLGYFVIFFVVSPIGGFLLNREISKRTNTVIIVCVTLGLFNIIFVGIAFALPLMYPEDEVLSSWSGIIGFIAGLLVAVSVGMYLNYLDESTNSKTALEEEMKNIDREPEEDELRFTFENNRRERLKKRKKRGRR